MTSFVGKSVCVLGFSLLAVGMGRPQPAVSLTVRVVDAGDLSPLAGVSVRVLQDGRTPAIGPTLADGTFTTTAVAVGASTIECNMIGFLRRPELKAQTLVGGSNATEVLLVPTGRDQNYFRRVGRNLEARGRLLAPELRGAYYRDQWERIRELDSQDLQLNVVRDWTDAKSYLTSDDAFSRLLEAGAAKGVPR